MPDISIHALTTTTDSSYRALVVHPSSGAAYAMTISAWPISTAVQAALDTKQNTLVSGTNIKTINDLPLIGPGNIVISGSGGTIGTLDEVLLQGASSPRTMDFNHNTGLSNTVRTITPDNYGTTYGGYVAQRYSETIGRFNGVNASGRPNIVYMFGYNQNSGGGRVSGDDGSIHISMESHYESGGDLFELHIPQVTSTNGLMNRLQSWTINKTNGYSLLFFTTESIEFRKVDTDQYYTAFAPGITTLRHTGSLSRLLMEAPIGGAGAGTLELRHDGLDTSLLASRHITISGTGHLNLQNSIYFTSGESASTDVVMSLSGAQTRFDFYDKNGILGLRINEAYGGINISQVRIGAMVNAKTTKLVVAYSDGQLYNPTLVEYADNAAALSGGLLAGDVYRTGDLLKIVH